MVYLRMTGLAQAHEVISYVCAALGNGQDMVYFLYRSQPTFLETPLTKRMLCGVAVTDAFPRSTVLAIDVRVALILVVLFAGNGCVISTVLPVR